MQFTMPSALRTADGETIGNQPPFMAKIVNGDFSIALPPMDAAGVVPQGWPYAVSIRSDVYNDDYLAVLPSSPNPTTLAAMVPLTSPPQPQTWVPLNTVGQPGGPAGPLTEGGFVPDDQLPSSSLGVLSVTAGDSSIAIAGTEVNPTVAVSPTVIDAIAGKVPLSLAVAKGNLFVATAPDTLAAVGVGTDGQVLVADSTQASGVRWANQSAGSGVVTGGTGVITGTFGPGGATGQPTTLPPENWRPPPIKATAGDVVLMILSIISTGGDGQGDVCSLVDGEPVNYYSGAYGPIQADEGHGGLYLSGDYGVGNYAVVQWIVQDTDLDGDGNLALSFLYQGGTGSRSWGHTTLPSQIDVTNFG